MSVDGSIIDVLKLRGFHAVQNENGARSYHLENRAKIKLHKKFT